MNEKDIKIYIDNNREKLPLSYHHALVYKQDKIVVEAVNLNQMDDYSNNNYSVNEFYKPISRFL